jgi:hypothetical protein
VAVAAATALRIDLDPLPHPPPHPLSPPTPLLPFCLAGAAGAALGGVVAWFACWSGARKARTAAVWARVGGKGRRLEKL